MELPTDAPFVRPIPFPKRYSSRVLIGVVLLHLVLGGLATIWVVAKYSSGRKLTFQAGPRSPNPSERALEHRVQLQKELRATNAPPAVSRLILTTGAAKVALPPMPKVEMPKSTPPPALGAGRTAIAFSATGASSLGGGGGGNGTAINFFGIRDLSMSVVIMIDVSNSMFMRTGDASSRKLVQHGKDQNFQTVREEAIQLVQSLTPPTRFGIVRWAGGAYAWKPELVFATDENKQAAIEHIQNEVDYKSAKPVRGKPGGTRHDYALAEAFALKPETIYMLTDGNATAAQPGGGLKPIPPNEIYKVAEDGQKTLTKKARLHVIYYLSGKERGEERAMLTGLASRNGGQFRKVEAKGRREK